MSNPDRDLAHLGKLLGECLGRIDDQVERLGRDGEVDGELLEDESLLLSHLVDSVVRTNAARPVDFDRLVEQAVDHLLQHAAAPVVVHQRLAGDLPRVACNPTEVAEVLRRALSLGARHAGHGGDLWITTSTNEHGVRCTVRCTGEVDPHFVERAGTLDEFVAGLGGSLEVSVGWDDATMAIGFPAELAGRD